MIIRLGRQRLRHEADLYKGPHAIGQQPIVDLIDVGPVVDRVALLVLAVDAVLIVEDRVKAHVLETGDLLYAPEIVAIPRPQAEIGAP